MGLKNVFFLWSNDIRCWACCSHWHFGFHHWLQGCLRFHDLCWSVLSAHRMGIDGQSEEMAKPIWNVVSECFGDCAVIWVFLKRGCTILPPKIAMFMKFGGFPLTFSNTPITWTCEARQYLALGRNSTSTGGTHRTIIGFLHVFTHPEFLASLRIYFRYWKILNRLGLDGLDGLGVFGFSFHSRTSALRECLIGPAPTLDLLWGFA